MDKSIAGIMAATLAFKGSGWALLVGFALNLILSNLDIQREKLDVPTTGELESLEKKLEEERKLLMKRKEDFVSDREAQR